jgi:hypothetical protein
MAREVRRRDWRGIGLNRASRPRGRNVNFFMCLFEETSNNPFACLLHGNGSISVATILPETSEGRAPSRAYAA